MTTTTVPAKTTRLQRGIRLFAERGHEITRLEIHTYAVPSSKGDETYTVFTDLRCCTCPDHRRAKASGDERCKHFHAAYIFAAKARAARRRRAS